MFCGNCGKKLIDGSLFCMECGTRVPEGKFSQKFEQPAVNQIAQPAVQRITSISAENSYKTNNDADLFGVNSFSEDAISAFSGAMSSFGAEGFQVPTVEDVDMSTGRIRQRIPKKGDEIVIENFSMTDIDENDEISDNIPVIRDFSMEEDPSKDINLDPYSFLGLSLDEGISMDEVPSETEKAVENVQAVEAVEAVEIEPISFVPPSQDDFIRLSAEPEIQPSVVEPVFVQPEPLVEPIVEQVEPVVEQAEPVAEQAEPIVEQAEPVAEQAEPIVEQAEPVVEQAEPVVEQAEPVTEQAGPVVEQAEPVVEQAAPIQQVIETVVQPVVENPQQVNPRQEQPPQFVNYEQQMPPIPQKSGVPIWLFLLVALGLVAAIVVIIILAINGNS